MFERYTEKARRVIFFARYEASNFGHPYIESEHLLLGLLREDKPLANRFLSSQEVESIRKQIEEHTTAREKIPTSVDLPLSHECRRALAFGAEESERLGHKHIGTVHLLVGLLREEKCFAAEMLQERGLRLSTVREELAREPSEEGTNPPGGPIPAGKRGTSARVPHVFNMPVETQAEVTRQAQARGIEVQSHLLALIEKALHPPPVQADAGAANDSRRETYNHLRKHIEAEGFPNLDAAQLDDEIARRKGVRP